MEMRPTIASMSSDSNIQKVPVIHKAALCCIFLSSDRLLIVEEPLKNHNWKPYSMIDSIYVLYSSHF